MFSLACFVGFAKIIGDVINNTVYRFANVAEGTSFTSLHDVFSAGEPYKSILGVFDIFTVWALVLAAVGLQKAGGASKRASWVAVTVLFVLKLLFACFFGLFAALIEDIFLGFQFGCGGSMANDLYRSAGTIRLLCGRFFCIFLEMPGFLRFH
ncbi:hypothetical protein QNH18_03250 [Bacillus paralicheniformis]|uniref:Yip1 domain-containing protein n=3 Tax=Bacillus paralicheniformis TaxID=1648923 RepID=A0AAW6KG84_9BACI|nr:YIP1 family protein [Bacillus paralicheniformis]MCJ8221610.1 hypothetical protein [Bacillus paralicheniformis]MDE1454655.1 hypothetical protein [Bacillus paralicheniformis]MDW6055629.1 hypothetical protein [Bacillus paralicheniformis]MED1066932.1 hypothetical protein [Bacillus paralicheniformis]MED1218217.1 hypothetical protein [Bacillus paralicheniformis]